MPLSYASRLPLELTAARNQRVPQWLPPRWRGRADDATGAQGRADLSDVLWVSQAASLTGALASVHGDDRRAGMICEEDLQAALRGLSPMLAPHWQTLLTGDHPEIPTSIRTSARETGLAVLPPLSDAAGWTALMSQPSFFQLVAAAALLDTAARPMQIESVETYQNPGDETTLPKGFGTVCDEIELYSSVHTHWVLARPIIRRRLVRHLLRTLTALPPEEVCTPILGSLGLFINAMICDIGDWSGHSASVYEDLTRRELRQVLLRGFRAPPTSATADDPAVCAAQYVCETRELFHRSDPSTWPPSLLKAGLASHDRELRISALRACSRRTLASRAASVP